MPPLRGPVPVERERVEVLRTRYDVMTAESDLRVAKAWELAAVAQQVVGLSLGSTLHCGDMLRTVSLAAGAAALASSPRASDRVLGRATASMSGRTFTVAHERRPIDPMDFWRAFCFAAVLRDGSTLAALARVVDDVDPDLSFAGRSGHERSFYRQAFSALCAWTRGAGETARAQASQLRKDVDELLTAMDDFHTARARQLVLPLVACCTAEEPEAVFALALEAHHAHWAEPQRRSDPAGFVAWGPLAAAATLLGSSAAGASLVQDSATDYLPSELLALLQQEPVVTSLRYDVPVLAARTLSEARLRVELSSPGEIVETGREQLADGRTLVELESRDQLRFHYRFELESNDAEGLGEGPASLIDVGELVHRAEREAARLADAAPGSSVAAEALRSGRACAARALALLGADAELFRDSMTSPLGRTMCDEHPLKFTPDALRALLAEFDDADAGEAERSAH